MIHLDEVDEAEFRDAAREAEGRRTPLLMTLGRDLEGDKRNILTNPLVCSPSTSGANGLGLTKLLLHHPGLYHIVSPNRRSKVRWGRYGRGGSMSLGGQLSLVAYLFGWSAFALGMSLAHGFFKDKFIVLWASFFLIPLIDAAWRKAFGEPPADPAAEVPTMQRRASPGGIAFMSTMVIVFGAFMTWVGFAIGDPSVFIGIGIICGLLGLWGYSKAIQSPNLDRDSVETGEQFDEWK
jgi:hypothetical protein